LTKNGGKYHEEALDILCSILKRKGKAVTLHGKVPDGIFCNVDDEGITHLEAFDSVNKGILNNGNPTYHTKNKVHSYFNLGFEAVTIISFNSNTGKKEICKFTEDIK